MHTTLSDIEKDQHDTTFISVFPYCDIHGHGNYYGSTRLLIEVIVPGIMAKTIVRTTYNSCKANLGSVVKPANIFGEEEAGQFFDEVLHIYPTNLLFNVTQYAYLIFNICIIQWQ